MRAFIAISLTQEVHAELALLQKRLDKSCAGIRWVKPSNIHLTLKFFKRIDDKQLLKIVSTLTDILKSHKSFLISLSEIGIFPNLNHPRVIWVGIKKGKKECVCLQKDIENSIGDRKKEKENRAFSPHLTIGRIKFKNNRPALTDLIEKEKNFSLKADIPVNAIILFQSIFTPKGPIYKSLEKFQLHRAGK
jgi:2'-5' RNA ligase